MATIRRVTVHRLRNVKPGCTFELHPGLNVLLGQNGTGKTTLLQWMADSLTGNLYSWSKEPYRVEIEMEAGAEPDQTRLRLLFDNDISEPTQDRAVQGALGLIASLRGQPVRSGLLTISISIAVGEDVYEVETTPSHLSFRANGTLLVDQETTRSATIWPAAMLLDSIQEVLFKFPSANTGLDSEERSIAKKVVQHLFPVAKSLTLQLRRFDESLDFFHHTVLGKELMINVASAQPAGSSFLPLVPDQLSQLIIDKIRGPESDVQTLTFTSGVMNGFLATAVELFQYRSADIHLTLLKKEVSERGQVSTYGDLRFTFHRHDGSIIGHDALSYGQKRMLSFLYYLALNPRLIIVDELVNGLHHAWIEACIDEIGDRQGLLTSQNPLLLDYLTFDSIDEVRQRFILCRSERENGREQLVWRNPTQEEAESFFRAYQAGIQHVGEILVDKGLW